MSRAFERAEAMFSEAAERAREAHESRRYLISGRAAIQEQQRRLDHATDAAALAVEAMIIEREALAHMTEMLTDLCVIHEERAQRARDAHRALGMPTSNVVAITSSPRRAA